MPSWFRQSLAPLCGAAGRVSLLACLATLSVRPSLADESAPCPASIPPADIRVSAVHAFPRVDYSHASSEIREQLRSAPHTVALGLTQSSTTLSVEVLLKAVQAPGQPFLCARPQVDVTLRHTNLNVWIARELAPDACITARVLEHEMNHVAIERDTLDWAAQQLQAQLQAWYETRVLRGTEAQIKAGLVRDFEERWTPALSALLETSSARHAKFDAQDSYGDAAACEGELMRSARRLQ
jgi:hypothetical protein